VFSSDTGLLASLEDLDAELEIDRAWEMIRENVIIRSKEKS
jgi:hypothetical protein